MQEGKMASWIIAALTGGLLLLAKMYRISVRENRDLSNFALLGLLDDHAQSVQKKALADLVRSIEAKNAGELGGRVFIATNKLAAPLSKTWPGTYDLLWKLKLSWHKQDLMWSAPNDGRGC